MLGGRMKLNSDAKTGGGHSLGVTSLAQAQSPWGRGRPWSEVRGGAPGESSGERGDGGRGGDSPCPVGADGGGGDKKR